MRQVGNDFERRSAERFKELLTGHGIAALVREADGDAVGVWIMDEDQMPEAENLLSRYGQNPDDPTLQPVPGKARADRSAALEDRARVVDVRSEIFRRNQLGAGQVTLALILLSIGLTLVSMAPGAVGLVRALYYSEYMGRNFPEILDGQVWRLVTPIFLHGGMLHLVFNMLWLYQLGGMIERNEGSRYFLVMTLLTAVVVNTSQYVVSGPLFLGMSGVVYMVLGYIWMMSRYKAGSAYALSQQTVVIMIVWLVICLVGLIPNTANTQHVVGLALGVAWGFLRSGYLTTLKRRRHFRG